MSVFAEYSNSNNMDRVQIRSLTHLIRCRNSSNVHEFIKSIMKHSDKRARVCRDPSRSMQRLPSFETSDEAPFLKLSNFLTGRRQPRPSFKRGSERQNASKFASPKLPLALLLCLRDRPSLRPTSLTTSWQADEASNWNGPLAKINRNDFFLIMTKWF